MTTFSVIIPVYNRAAALGDAIRSVLAQDCQDFEIVIVDDGSHDDPKSVVDAFGDSRIRIITQQNQGGGVARNRAIDEARGRYIAPLDSDDVFLPHHLSTMKALLADRENMVGYARVLVNRGDGQFFLKPPRAVRGDEDMGEYLLCDRGFVPTITIVVPRELAARVRYTTTLRPGEDMDFAVRLAQTGAAFVMAEEAGAVWNDLYDPARSSAHPDPTRFGNWLDVMKPHLTRRAWLGARGWAFAKLVAPRSPMRALGLYLRAVLAGCYAPRLATVIFLQVMLGKNHYRRLADFGVALGLGLRRP